MVSGWKADDVFVIEWDVFGDETEVDHYEVSVRVVRPETTQVYFGHVLRARNVPVGSRIHCGKLDVSLPGDVAYLAAQVIAVPKDPANSSPHHQRFSPARAVFPAVATLDVQPRLQRQFTYRRAATGKPNLGQITQQGGPVPAGAAAWLPGQAESHNAILFDSGRPAWNLALRPEAGEELTASFLAPNLVGRHRLVAYVGLLGASAAVGSAEVEIRTSLSPSAATGTVPLPSVAKAALDISSGGPPPPLQRLEQVVDAGSTPTDLKISVHAQVASIAPKHPPALFGLRMIPEGQQRGIPREPDKTQLIELKNETLYVWGTAGHDTIKIAVLHVIGAKKNSPSNVQVHGVWDAEKPWLDYQSDLKSIPKAQNGRKFSRMFPFSQVKRIYCDVHAGHDYVSLSGDGIPLEAHGGPGRDSLGTRASNTGHNLNGEEENDMVYGGHGPDKLYGGPDSDFIRGNEGDDYLYGGPDQAADELWGGPGSDTLDGGPGDDQLWSERRQGGTLIGGPGWSNKFDKSGLPPIPIETLIGGEGNDKLYGDWGYDTLDGGPGNDELDGGDGYDTLHGGPDNDTLRGGEKGDHLYGGPGKDKLVGMDGDDHIQGGPGDDDLIGGPGSDMLLGGLGDDVLHGWNGSDYWDVKLLKLYNGSLDSVYDGNDSLYGQGGNDHLYGEGGDDELNGGAGDDKLYGGRGDDHLYAYELFRSAQGGSYWHDVGTDTLWGGCGKDHLYGDDGPDEMHGGPDPDKLFAASGNDKLDGGEDADELHGGKNDDLLYGGLAIDHLYGDEGTDYLFSGGISMDHMWGGQGGDGFCLLGDPNTLALGHPTTLVDKRIKDENLGEGDTRVLGHEADFIDGNGKFSWVEQ
jgi:Ca2+-binding RTX toxin-like protein